MSVRLGELLTKASLISPDQLKDALKLQKETGGKLGETLIKLGFVAEEDITECLSQQFGVPSINLVHFEIDSSVIKLIPYDEAYESGFEDMPRRVPDLTRIKGLIGYEPKHELDEILEQVIDYFRKK